jgi:hypothetical protein
MRYHQSRIPYSAWSVAPPEPPAPLPAILLGCLVRRGRIDSTTSRRPLLVESPRVLSNKHLTASPTHCSHALPLPHQHSVAAQSVRPLAPARPVSPAQPSTRPREPSVARPLPEADGPPVRPALACALDRWCCCFRHPAEPQMACPNTRRSQSRPAATTSHPPYSRPPTQHDSWPHVARLPPRNLGQLFRQTSRSKPPPAASSPLSPSVRRFSYQSAAHVWGVDNVAFASHSRPRASVGVPSWPQTRHALYPFSHKSGCAGLDAVALYRQCISPSGADSAFGDIMYQELYDCSLEMFRQSPTDDCPRLCKRNVLGRTFVFPRLRVSSSPGTLYQETEPRASASRS